MANKDPNIANSVHKIAALHNFTEDQRSALERAFSDHAAIMSKTKIGTTRNALYPTHSEQIIDQFKHLWQAQTTSSKWLDTSIRKVLSGHIHHINKGKGLTKKMTSKSKSKGKQVNNASDASDFIAHSVEQEDDTVISEPDTVLMNHDAEPADSTRPTPSITSERLDNYMACSLAEIIVVVRPSTLDPWKRKIISFPLWRCQSPVDGRDAPPHELLDWRDLSFADFLRQLSTERAISKNEAVFWGEYGQVVTSNLTFAGAIQEQLQGAKENGLALNEATFMIAPSPV